VDVKGGLFTGVQLRLDSLRSLLAGGISFATPEKMGEAAGDGAEFALFDEPKKEWLEWSPKIALPGEDSSGEQKLAPLPTPSSAVQSAVK
jgi:hypothetical protein